MRYEFREVTYKGKTIRFIKAIDFDSDGNDTAPLDELIKVQKRIALNTLVIVMAGHGNSITTDVPFLNEYYQLHPRKYDENYMWLIGEIVQHF